MKKKCLAAVLVFAALLACYLFGTGFMKNGAVYVADFAVSEDGSMITLNVGVGVSAGYVRKLAVHQQAGGKLYLDPYYAFGGFNGSPARGRCTRFCSRTIRPSLRFGGTKTATKKFCVKTRTARGSASNKNGGKH